MSFRTGGNIQTNQNSISFADAHLDFHDDDGDDYGDRVEVFYSITHEGIVTGEYEQNITLWQDGLIVETNATTVQINGLEPINDSMSFGTQNQEGYFNVTIEITHNTDDFTWNSGAFWLDGYNQETPYFKDLGKSYVDDDNDSEIDGIDYELNVFYNATGFVEINITSNLYNQNNESVYEHTEYYFIFGNESNFISHSTGKVAVQDFYYVKIELFWNGVLRDNDTSQAVRLDRYYDLTEITITSKFLRLEQIASSGYPRIVLSNIEVQAEEDIELLFVTTLYSITGKEIQIISEYIFIEGGVYNPSRLLHHDPPPEFGEYYVIIQLYYADLKLYEWQSEVVELEGMPVLDLYISSYDVYGFDSDQDEIEDSIRADFTIYSSETLFIAIEFWIWNHDDSYHELITQTYTVGPGNSEVYTLELGPVPDVDIYYVDLFIYFDNYPIDFYQIHGFELEPLGVNSILEHPEETTSDIRIVPFDYFANIVGILVLYRIKRN